VTGLGACRDLALRVGGFLDVRETNTNVTLAAFLRTQPDVVGSTEPRQQALVVHRNQRVARTLASALSELDIHVARLKDMPDDTGNALVFTDVEHEAIPGAVIVVLPGEHTDSTRKLRFPFAVDQLARHLESRHPSISEE